MPDLYLDFSWVHPDPADMVGAGVRGILVYITPNQNGQFNTPPPEYLASCIAGGIAVSPIFETAGERANDGYDAGRQDGSDAVGWMARVGIADGVRLFLNVADTPNSGGNLAAIRDYARGFSETFPRQWQLGAYGNLGALRVSQQGSDRFDKLWAVETWYPGSSPRPDDNWQYWLGQPDVVLVQMANIPPPLDGTDTNWLVPGRILDGWGGDPPTQHGVRMPFNGEFPINSPWGPRDGGFHYGIDFGLPMRTPVVGVAPSECIYAAFEAGGAGNHLVIKLDYPPAPGVPKAGYMHLDSFAVAPGDRVEMGQVVGWSNNTGGSTGPHLHFWMGENGNTGAVDPTPFLAAGPPAPPEPKPIPKKKGHKDMWCACLLDTNWVDVWYQNVIVDGFHNEDINAFNVGPRLQSYLNQGAGLTLYADPSDYTKEGGVRDRLEGKVMVKV